MIPLQPDKCQWITNYSAFIKGFDIEGTGLEGPFMKQLIDRIIAQGMPFTGLVMMKGECKCCEGMPIVFEPDPPTIEIQLTDCKRPKECPDFEKQRTPGSHTTGTGPLFGKQWREYRGEAVKDIPNCPKLVADPITGEFHYDPECEECCKGGGFWTFPISFECSFPPAWVENGVPSEDMAGNVTYTPLRDVLMRASAFDPAAIQELEPMQECIKSMLKMATCPPPVSDTCMGLGQETENFCNETTRTYLLSLEHNDPDGWKSKSWYEFERLNQRGLIPTDIERRDD